MAPHQQRVVDEKTELDDKISKLSHFMAGDFFSTLGHAERNRLATQLNCMAGYSHVLGWRIEAFFQA